MCVCVWGVIVCVGVRSVCMCTCERSSECVCGGWLSAHVCVCVSIYICGA
jgi:hypothetical protein